MPEMPIDILPGGQLSDIAENKLGRHQHQTVRNFRKIKDGEWQSVEGYKNVLTGLTGLKAGIEVSDDQSGDRFLLVQDGTAIKRIDYDISNSPLFGYENESPSTLTLPSGVTIGASATLRFFYFRGVVRIAGASEPLWYGYIERTMFLYSWDQKETNDFEASVATFNGSDATVAQSAVQAFMDSNSMLVTQTAADGYAYRSYPTTVGKHYKVSMWVYKASGGSGAVRMSLGTTQGGAEYTYEETGETDTWVRLQAIVKATATSIYANFNPGVGGTAEAAYFDEWLIEETDGIDVADWYLYPASLDKVEITTYNQYRLDTNSSYDTITVFMKTFAIYDDSQYSLLENARVFPRTDTTPYTNESFEVLQGQFGYGQIFVQVDEDIIKRITGIGIAFGYVTGKYFLESDITWRVAEILDIKDQIPTFSYTEESATLRYDPANADRLDCSTSFTPPDKPVELGQIQVGTRVHMKNANGELETKCTAIGYVGSTTTLDYIEFADDISPLATNPAAAEDLPAVTVTIYRDWVYDSSNGIYKMVLYADPTVGDIFWTLADIPADTISNTPNYDDYAIVEERAYCNSLEDDEEDSVRFSPEYQYDNFPITNIMQTEVGDVDTIQRIIKRSNRLVMLKQYSISQGNYLSGRYSEDIGIARYGIYANYGILVIGETLFYMGEEDIYVFRGLEPSPLMRNQRMRQIYKQYVSTDSILGYDQANDELYVILNGGSKKVLIYQFAWNEWYERDADVDPTFVFRGFDNKLYLGLATKIITFNHSSSPYDEDISGYIETRIFDDITAEFQKKLNDIKVLCRASEDIDITALDPNNAALGSYSGSISPNATYQRHSELRPRFMFKQLVVTLETDAADNLDVVINNIRLILENWNAAG